MPRQKLTWKQPKLKGKAGQVQPGGAHDPEHQQGATKPDKENMRATRGGKNAANPRLANKKKAL
jgi:hypothetical protein